MTSVKVSDDWVKMSVGDVREDEGDCLLDGAFSFITRHRGYERAEMRRLEQDYLVSLDQDTFFGDQPTVRNRFCRH